MEQSITTPSDSQSEWSSGGSNSGSFSDGVISPKLESGFISSSPIPTALVASPHQIHQEFFTLAPRSASLPTEANTAIVAAQNGNPKPGHTRQGRFACEEDWVRHRHRITSLYKTRTLQDVKAVMEKEHNFHASQRMYKARFKEWGVKKNVTAAEVHKLTQKVGKLQQQQRAGPYQITSTGENERVVINVGGQDVRRVQRYIKRRPKGLEGLRRDPHRPLDVLKALSVDDRDRPGEVSIATAKLEDRSQSHDNITTLPSPPLDSFPSWSPGPHLPAAHIPQPQHYATKQHHQFFMGNGFDGTDPNAYLSPPTQSFEPPLPPQWQNHNHGHGHNSAVGNTVPALGLMASRAVGLQTDLPLGDLSFGADGGLFNGYDASMDWQQQATPPSHWLSGPARPHPMGSESSSLGNSFGLMYGNANAY